MGWRLLAIFVFAALAATDAGIRVQLRRLGGPVKTLTEVDKENFSLQQKYIFPRGVRTKRSAAMPLINLNNLQYCVSIAIGSPPKSFNVQLDTGSADFWVTSKQCKYQNGSGCISKQKYDSTVSSTYKSNGAQVTLQYSTTVVSGFLSSDYVTIANKTVKNQIFIEATGGSAIGNAYDGILGLGFSSLSLSRSTPLFYNLISQGMISSQVFSLYLSSNQSSPNGGEMTIGGSNPAYYRGSFIYVNVIYQFFWQIKADRMEVNGNPATQFCVGGCQTVFDSGTSLITGPTTDIAGINRVIGGHLIDFNKLQLNCNNLTSLPNISFVFNGKAFVLGGHQYSYKANYRGATICVSAFTALDVRTSLGILWILGDSFMSSVYTQFDLGSKRIGLAQLRN